MFVHVSVWGVILAAVAGMIVGTVWYHPSVFGKAWMKAIGQTEKGMKERMNKVMPVLVLASLVTAYALSLVTTYLSSFTLGSPLSTAIEASLLVGFGFGATAVVAHGVFEPRPMSVIYINVGNRVATLLAMGLVIGLFMR
jgi:hypothetical protein